MTTQALRNHDKMKDDAIAQLSDQVMALTARNAGIRKKAACLLSKGTLLQSI